MVEVLNDTSREDDPAGVQLVRPRGPNPDHELPLIGEQPLFLRDEPGVVLIQQVVRSLLSILAHESLHGAGYIGRHRLVGELTVRDRVLGLHLGHVMRDEQDGVEVDSREELIQPGPVDGRVRSVAGAGHVRKDGLHRVLLHIIKALDGDH